MEMKRKIKNKNDWEFLQYYYEQYGFNTTDLEEFTITVQQDLPSCIRFNANVNNVSLVKEQMMEIYNQYQQKCIDNKLPKLILNKINWYPKSDVFQFNQDRNTIKKTPLLKPFHRFLVECNQSGIIQRQELVSMIPPIFLDIQENDLVLDMCASPGSKTSQIVEFLRGHSGGVLANELDFKRAWILSHQMKKLNFPGISVVNHPGQFIPKIHKDNQQVLFDKVLVDVPCSGDGAIRKLPIRWINWSPFDGISYHPLQLQLLIRSIKLTKVGGLIVYSTCSLNCLENEAVITAMLSLFNEKERTVELVDVHSSLKGFKLRKGQENWKLKVYKKNYLPQSKRQEYKRSKKEDIYQILSNYQDVLDSDLDLKLKNKIHKNMFPIENNKEIQKSAKILPHDNNSGGFYFALIRKIKNLEKDIKIQANNKQYPLLYKNKIENYKKLNEKVFLDLKDILCLKDNFPFHLLINPINSEKRINIVSEKIMDLLNADENNKMQKVYTGTNVFVKSKSEEGIKNGSWRFSQNGIQTIKKYIKKEKIFPISQKLFLYILKQKQNMPFGQFPEDLKSEEEEILKLGFGSFCFSYTGKNMESEDLIISKWKHSIVLMMSKEDIAGMILKYKKLI